MLKRREFLKHSAIVATVATTGIFSVEAKTDAAKRIDLVLVDDEFEDSVAFAQVLAARGARLFSVQQDLGQLWFGELGQAFKPGLTLAGLTSHTDLLVSASFARQHGARVRFEGSHDCRGSDVLTHALRVGIVDPPLGTVLSQADRHWPQILAARLPHLSLCEQLRDDTCRTQTQRSDTHPGSLFSWVIA